MKIASITPYLFNARSGRNLCLVRVDTDEGIHGWGECYTVLRKEQIAEHYVKLLAEYLVGRDVFDIRHHWQIIFDDFSVRRSNLDTTCAWSGIEIALWDIIGKKAGLPLYKLFGGANRGNIRVYANGWDEGCKTIDEICGRAAAVVKRGFTSIKWDPYFGPWRTFISKKQEDEAVEHVRRMRETVGPNVDLLIDAHRRVSPHQAISFARRIEEYNIFQFEDPNLADNVHLIAESRRGIKQPVVCGEVFYTKEQFAALLEARAVDIINPDVSVCGGLLQFLQIAAMAEPYGVAVSPHNNNSTVIGLAATLHVSKAIPNFLIAEHFVNLETSNEFGIDTPVIQNGYAVVPEGPGLGVDVNLDVLKAYPYTDFASRNLRHPEDEFPKEGVV
jgi:galactonate dehydratase